MLKTFVFLVWLIKRYSYFRHSHQIIKTCLRYILHAWLLLIKYSQFIQQSAVLFKVHFNESFSATFKELNFFNPPNNVKFVAQNRTT